LSQSGRVIPIWGKHIHRSFVTEPALALSEPVIEDRDGRLVVVRELLNEVLGLPGLKMYRHVKKSRIYMFGKYLKYPFELQNLLRAMRLRDSALCGLSFGWNVLAKPFRTPTLVSYRDWFVHLYGRRLYEIMCRPYTSKIWHTDPANISADWADQRFQGENLKKLLKRIAKKILTFDFSSYNLEDDSLAPDGGPFYYPSRGIQELPDALDSLNKRADVLWGVADQIVLNPQTVKPILLFSLRNRIPFVGLSATWVKAGALYALDRDYKDIGRQCGELALKILQGTAPSALPPVPPRKVVYSVNLKTAHLLKLDLGGQVLQAAQTVIE